KPGDKQEDQWRVRGVRARLFGSVRRHEKRVEEGPGSKEAGQRQDHAAERAADASAPHHPCSLCRTRRSRSSTVTKLGSRKSLLTCDEKTSEPDMTSRAGPSATTSPSPRSPTRS